MMKVIVVFCLYVTLFILCYFDHLQYEVEDSHEHSSEDDEDRETITSCDMKKGDCL